MMSKATSFVYQNAKKGKISPTRAFFLLSGVVIPAAPKEGTKRKFEKIKLARRKLLV